MPSKTTTRRKTTTGTTGSADSRRTEYLPLAGLEPDPRNPKAHDLDTIDASVGRFGLIDPIVRDDRTGRLISGHGRVATLRAMHSRGEAPPDGVRFADEDEAGDWLVPVTVGWASRTDAEARAALVALNRTTELGGWVDNELLAVLDELSEQGADAFVGVGFSDEEIEEVRNRVDDFGSEAGDFLDDLADNGGSRSQRPEPSAPTGFANVTFVLAVDDRDRLNKALRAEQKRLGGDATKVHALLSLTGCE